MPLYEYECPECGRFERIQKFSDAILTKCPTCDKDVEKLLSAPAIQFKGTGWYVTDYADKGKSGSKDKKDDGGKKDDSSKKASSDSSKSGDSSKKSDSSSAKSTSSDSSKSSSSNSAK